MRFANLNINNMYQNSFYYHCTLPSKRRECSYSVAMERVLVHIYEAFHLIH
jgi:hypothetical protein